MTLLQGPAWFGEYRLTSRIATGGMAEVYLGRHVDVSGGGKLGPMVAVKRLLPHLISDAMIVRMFLNEALITAQVQHPNVVKIVQVGEVEGEPFIAMELLEGHSFAELRQQAALAGRRVPLGVTLRVLAEACHGLGAAHRAVGPDGRALQIVHRDFTPDNIHVGVSGEVKVIDFGIAKSQTLGAGTEPGTLKGKFFYMSPEMIAGRAVDHRADQFAAGVMLYEELCGRRPFTGLSTEEVLDRISEVTPRAPSSFDPSIPRALDAICFKALAKDPDQRFGSLEELVEAFQSVGGAAVLASREGVAEYVVQLFPVEQDSARQTLRRAISADSSQPSTKRAAETPAPAHPGPRGGGSGPLAGPGGGGGAHSTPAPSARPLPGLLPLSGAPLAEPGPLDPSTTSDAQGWDPRVPVPAVTEKAQPAGWDPRVPVPAVTEKPAPVAAPPSPEAIAARKRLIRFGAMGAGGLALLVALIFGVRAALPSEKTAAQRLTAAKAATVAEERAKLLAPLADDVKVSADELAAATELLLGAKQADAALPLADALTSRFGADMRGHLAAARAAIVLHKGKRADAAIQRAAQLSPNDAQPDLLLAELRQMQGDLPGALEALGKARKKQPDSIELAVQQGNLLSQANRLDEAADVLSAALQRRFDADAAAELGFVRFRQEQLEPAAALLKKALRKDPKLFKGHYYLGAVLFRQGDVKGAERAYHEADALAPDDPRALAALCELQAKSGSADAAGATGELIAKRFPAQAVELKARCVP